MWTGLWTKQYVAGDLRSFTQWSENEPSHRHTTVQDAVYLAAKSAAPKLLTTGYVIARKPSAPVDQFGI